MYAASAFSTAFTGLNITPGKYVIDKTNPDRMYYVSDLSPESEYILKYADKRERDLFYGSLSSEKKANDALMDAYGSLSPSEKIIYYKKYAKFGEEGDLTWEDVKKSEPAAYLKTDESGNVYVDISL